MAIIKRVLCMDLPTAGYVIGYLGILGGIYKAIEIHSGIMYFDYHYASAADTYKELSDKKETVFAILYVMLVLCVLELLSCILLVYGIKKNSHKMILPWLSFMGIGLVLLIPLTSLGVLLGLFMLFNGQGGVFILKMVGLVIVAAIYCYSYMVIFSLYQFIRDQLLRKPQQTDSEGLYSHF